MTTLHTVSFQKTVLASLIGLCLSQSVFALQEISDEGLSQATGEGIAFLPEGFSMILQGTKDNNGNEITTTTAENLANRNLDTGYIRYIPVGPLSSTAPATAGKADLYLYGLAVSKGDRDLNNRFGDHIASWGTADNPWLFKVQTEENVPNFGPTNIAANNCATTPDNCKVTYLALEAPRYDLVRPTDSALGADAYNLKLAFWADAFVRDPKQAEFSKAKPSDLGDTTTQFNLNGTDRANRMRLQAVWDGFSINGSQIQMFQTLGGAVSGATNGYIKDSSYNNTLGMAGVLRFNSGDTRASNGFKATISTTTPTLEYVDDSGTVLGAYGSNNGWLMRYTPTASTQPVSPSRQGSTNCSTPGSSAAFECSYQIRSRTTRVSNANGWTWTAPSLANNGVLRFSTRETGTTQGKLDSPAVNGVVAPNFDSTEGLYAYGANINLVLGTLYQPLMVNKDASSNNLVLEIAAIPNKPDIYKKIYTAYDGYLGSANKAEYSGSTCSAYACGKNATTNYQGTNATHSSISIGSTEYDPTTGLMTAYKGADAVGVSFGVMPTSVTAAPTSPSYYYEIQNRERRRGNSSNWQYCTGSTNGKDCSSWTGNQGSGLKFNGQNAVWKDVNGNTSLLVPRAGVNYPGYTVTGDGADYVVGAINGQLPGSVVNNSDGTWRWYDNRLATGTTANDFKIADSAILNKLATENNFTNLGSAVIDGMLIQHMKITTKGL